VEAELLFITASIIARQMRFVNTFFQKNSKNMIFPKKSCVQRPFQLSPSTTTLFFMKKHQKPLRQIAANFY
jgi:hypothetical protein